MENLWIIYGWYMGNIWVIYEYGWYTLWLCQNSFGKWPFIVGNTHENGGSFHSYVKWPEGWYWTWRSQVTLVVFDDILTWNFMTDYDHGNWNDDMGIWLDDIVTLKYEKRECYTMFIDHWNCSKAILRELRTAQSSIIIPAVKPNKWAAKHVWANYHISLTYNLRP